MLKKFSVLMLGFLFAPVVLAKEINIGVAMYSLADKYPTYLQDAMQNYAKDHPDIKLRFWYDSNVRNWGINYWDDE